MAEFGQHWNKVWRVTAWRETVSKTPWRFATKRLRPGEQLEITEQRVRFRVERSFKKTPNACNIYIYNLAEDTRSDLETRPLSVQIEAGYAESGGPRLMYRGDLRFGMSDQTDVTSETLLQLGSNARMLKHSRTQRSYKEGTTYRQVIKDIAGSMGLALPSNVATDPSLDRQLINGGAVLGSSADELTRMLEPLGYQWSIQNDQLRILREDEVNAQTALPIDEEHGMIGTPTYGSPPRSGKPPHMKVRMLLYPELLPGDLVMLTSKVRSGLFRINRVVHEGDSHSKEHWTSEVELKPHSGALGSATARQKEDALRAGGSNAFGL